MKINEKIHGFQVVRIRDVPEQNGTLYEMIHEKTGAKLAWLERDEENKTFCISFKTVPEDDTGVFHILEHSVLNGSDRYPVKEPFVELMKSSLQTFLNALTYPDKTVYPVSSRNNKDFENLVRIYLDAVFHPRIYRCREIFDQEGWHYEPREGGNGFYCNGVVLNEMKGAYSSVDTIMISEMNKLLFPDTCYRYKSGGHPEHITELSYEQFIENHKRFYHPSNAKIFLDGSLPIAEILQLIDGEYLSAFEKRACSFPIGEQTAAPYAEKTVFYPAAEGTEQGEAAHIATGYIAGRFDEKEKIAAMNLLADYLTGDNDAPLTKAILEQELGQSVEASFYDGIQQPYLLFFIRNVDKKNKDRILATIRQVLLDTVQNGINVERMKALINCGEFHAHEQNYGWLPTGVGLALSVLDSWNFDGDPMQNLESDSEFAFLREHLEQGYFEELIQELLLNSQNEATVLLLPDTQYDKKQQEAEEKRIQSRIAHMSKTEQEEIFSRLDNLRKAQQTPDTEEALRTIPKLSLSDMDRLPKRIPTDLVGDSILFHELPTRGIQYIRLFFPLSGITEAELPAVSFACDLLGKLATEHYSSEALNTAITSDLGRIGASVSFFQGAQCAEKCQAYVQVHCCVLEKKADKALHYIEEVFLRTEFSDSNRIKEILTQRIDDFKQGFIESGHQLGMIQSGAGTTASGVVSDAVSGLSAYRWMQSSLKEYNSSFAALSKQLKALCSRIFVKNGLTVTITGHKDVEFAEKLTALFPSGGEKNRVCVYQPHGQAAEGIEIPAPVAYAVQNAHLSALHSELSGTQKVFAKLVSLEYLWQMVRVQGGAYGTGLQFSSNGNVTFYSYRDPNPSNSIQVYQDTAKFIREMLKSSPDITGVILGTLAQVDPLMTPEAAGQYADAQYFSGNTYEKQCILRKEILETTPQKLLELCSLMESAAEKANICVVGGRDMLDDCRLDSIQTL